jgi:hypothetical protein
MTPAIRFREALSNGSSLSHLQRLAGKLNDIRNSDPSTRATSLAIATQANRLDVVEWLLLDCDHDQEEISRVRCFLKFLDSAGWRLLLKSMTSIGLEW